MKRKNKIKQILRIKTAGSIISRNDILFRSDTSQ